MERYLMEEPHYLSVYLKCNPKYEIHGVKRHSRTSIMQVRCLHAHRGRALQCSHSLVEQDCNSPLTLQKTQLPPRVAFVKTEQI